MITAYSTKTGYIAPPLDFTLRDKVDHFAVYGLLAILAYQALPARLVGPRRWLTAFLLISSFGLCDEVIQHYNPYRTGDPLDWFADSLGALLAVVLYSSLPWLRAIANWRPFERKNRSTQLCLETLG
ncbi:hypothetical protein VDG1235_1589 [Verrucomicrobiia bacterium DG1235]|nr:hypothetical protein VDG1235_1589 [Verrucomicrobiae bacterium DG1235]